LITDFLFHIHEYLVSMVEPGPTEAGYVLTPEYRRQSKG
jgi:hypothetical protein